MRSIAMLAAAAALFAAAPVAAQVPVGAPQDGTPTIGAAPGSTTEVKADGQAQRSGATGDPERRICRKSAPTGTRIANAKVCKSAREWEAQRLAAKEELERHQRPDGTNGG